MALDVPALILVGGLGTRLRSVLNDRPKPLAPVGGRPFVTFLLDQLQAAGCRRVTLCTGYRSQQVAEAIGSRFGSLEVTYSVEPEPLGTGGAVRLAMSQAPGELFLVMNGDSYVNCSLGEFFEWHRAHGCPGSLVLTRVADAGRFGTVEVDEAGRIQSFREKEGLSRPGWINAGVYLLPRRWVEALPAGPMSLERDGFPVWLRDGLGGFAREAAFLDVGTPETLAQAEAFFAAARPGDDASGDI